MSGQGHPESADIAGMPAEYLVRQMKYFKSGARKEEARMGPIARAVSDDDVEQAALEIAELVTELPAHDAAEKFALEAGQKYRAS